jgi:predicted permease
VTGSVDTNRRITISGTSFISGPGPQGLLFSLLLLVGTLAVLLLTGANIAHLQLARAMSRQREILTRMALGAGRARVARQLVTEALLLSVVAGVISLAIVYGLTGTLMRVSEIPVREVWTPDVYVFLYCFGIAALMSLVFGLTPALRTTRVSLVQSAGQTAQSLGRLRFNTVLLSLQIALCVSVLSGASLMARAVTHAMTADHLGFAVEGVTAAMVVPGSSSNRADVNAHAFVDALEAALSGSGLPRIAFVDAQPFMGDRPVSARRPDEGPQQTREVNIAPVSAATFEVLGIPLVEGRPATDQVGAGEAVVNQKLAGLFWPGTTAIGQRLIVTGQGLPEGRNTFTVVGVTRDVFYGSFETMSPLLYVAPTMLTRYPSMLVRATGPAVTEQINAIVVGLNPRATVTIRPLTDNISTKLTDYRIGKNAAWAGGLLGLALAGFGVFGVFSYVVEERRREIGIRLALGAQRMQLLAMLFGTTRRATLAGLIGGLLLSLGIGPVMGRYLYGLNPFDPIAFASVAAILTLTGFAATALPARRALSVDPAVTLRQDT